MPTDPRRPRDDAGFTLIEVVIAMMVLAFGLLGLEALGIAAARSVTGAAQKSDLVTGATDVMEETIQRVRRNPAGAASPNQCGTDEGSGLYVCRQVDTRATVSALTSRTARISVTVSRSAASTDQLTISSYVFHPQLPQ